ncbi:MAG: DUF4249 family protein [Saprospiraceae bacterium]|nr:DUF4249 family protein [Saprospiraceae bacterium]
MKKYARLAVLLLLAAGFNRCQYPVETSTLPDAIRYLVIDAELTETFGKVNVSYTLTDVTPQGAYTFPPRPVASAYVLDSQGNRSDFNPDGTKDTTFRGKVGETYRLYVEADGQLYESAPETMRACPALDSVAPVYRRESFRAPSELYYDGFDVYAQLVDLPNEENYYQWDWIHYGRAFSCARIYSAAEGRDVLLPCSPYDCWNIVYNMNAIVQSDKLREGQALAQKVLRVPFARPPRSYYLRVEQRSITPSVFAYLQSIQTQTQNTGSLFDIPAQTRFNPNVHKVDNPAAPLLGVFSVYSSRYKIIHLNMEQQIPGAVVKIIPQPAPFISDPLASAPCEEGPFRTLIRPEDWRE